MLRKPAFRSVGILLVLAMLLTALTACGKKSEEEGASLGSAAQNAQTLEAEIQKDPKFDSARIDLNADDLEAAGISFGDSCDLTFSNGCTLTDVPYYNGYYVKAGDHVLVAYANTDYILIAANCRDFWTPEGLKDGDTVTITLNTAGKYLATYEALSQSYSVDRVDYPDDESFTNFRAMSGGRLKANYFYRGASSVDDSRNRAPYADRLIEEAGVQFILNLADCDEEILEFFGSEEFDSNYSRTLFEDGRVAALSLNANYDGEEYKTSLANGLRLMMEYDGPVYIHCTEGKDRTGFVCIVLEALAGASYDEMCDDYMETYDNYFDINEKDTPESYDAIVALYFDTFMEYLSGEEDVSVLKKADYTEYARNYLKDCGMTENEIDELTEYLTK